MKFNLSPEITDQIIFAMENQNGLFLFDSVECSVVQDGQLSGSSVVSFDEDSEDRYFELPSWTSADGFYLMEKFVANLRNPVYCSQLREALNSGKGVFRNFKNVLKQREDIQRLWYNFKDREMKSRVLSWYNELCDLWGIAGLGPEPPETEDLVLSDFLFRFCKAEDLDFDSIVNLDKEGFLESFEDYPDALTSWLTRMRCERFSLNPRDYDILLCETPSLEPAGFLLSTMPQGDTAETSGIKIIRQIYIKPEFRGMGLAKQLVEVFMQDAYENGIRNLIVDSWGGASSFLTILEETGFNPLSVSLMLDLDDWGKRNKT